MTTAHRPVDGESSYWTMHRRVRALRGPASAHLCAGCGASAAVWSYDGRGPDEHRDPARGRRYTLDPGRYQARCRSCHRRAVGTDRSLTDADAEQVAALYRAGNSLAVIAARLHVPQPVVRAALARRGVTIRAPHYRAAVVDPARVVSLYAAGESVRGAARQLGISRAAVRAVLVAHGVALRDRTAVVDAGRAAALYEGGASVRGIAAVLGAPRTAVRAALTAHGVEIRPPGPTRRHLPRQQPATAPLGQSVQFRPFPTISHQPPPAPQPPPS